MRAILLLLAVGRLSGCGCGPTPALPRVERSSPAAAPTNPLAMATTPSSSERAFGGVVSERLHAGGYSYVRIDDDDAQRWVATLGVAPPVLATVRVEAYGAANDFHSRRLDRNFSRLLFGTVHSEDQQPAQPKPTSQ